MSKSLETLQRVDDWLRGHEQNDAADLVLSLKARIEREEAGDDELPPEDAE
jgi:hypothetical protein